MLVGTNKDGKRFIIAPKRFHGMLWDDYIKREEHAPDFYEFDEEDIDDTYDFECRYGKYASNIKKKLDKGEIDELDVIGDFNCERTAKDVIKSLNGKAVYTFVVENVFDLRAKLDVAFRNRGELAHFAVDDKCISLADTIEYVLFIITAKQSERTGAVISEVTGYRKENSSRPRNFFNINCLNLKVLCVTSLSEIENISGRKLSADIEGDNRLIKF